MMTAAARGRQGRPQRWDGMTRGIGRGLRGAAVDIATGSAARAVSAALAAERPGLAPHTRVRILAGPHAGRNGHVRSAAWLLDDAACDVVPGREPPGYEVSFEMPDGGRVTLRAAELAPAPVT
ncbi:hypothetical protein [Streptomyces monomycini]|uniref:hypothetical protein n=1 Tax=Streptomyces monomycini TaxID=371720 RepID=UPI0004AB57A7|nr:hypothetical protein [Streptomyces monomycini]